MFPARRRLPLLVVLFLVGCGGGGGGKSITAPTLAKEVAPTISIAWPERSRDVTAPTSALSATIALKGANADGTDLSFSVNRPSGAPGSSQTYTAPTTVRRQTALLSVSFFTNADAKGVIVGTASATVTVSADGSLNLPDGAPLGTLRFEGVIQSVAVTSPGAVPTGKTVDLAVTAMSAAGPVVVSPGSITLSLYSGADVFRLEGGMSVTALKDGIAAIVATVDGRSSAPTTVVVNDTPLVARTIDLVTSKLVADPKRGRIWAALPTAGAGGSGIVAIDPAQGTLGAVIPVGSNPTTMAITDDASTMYVGLRGSSSVRRVDLDAGTAGQEFGLTLPPPYGTPGYALDLAVPPGSTSTVAAIIASESFSGSYGPFLYDEGARRPNNPGSTKGTRMAFTSGSRLVSVLYPFSSSNLYDFLVDAQGATLQRTATATAGFYAYGLTVDGAYLFSEDGSVFAASSLTKLGNFLPNDAQNGPARWYGPVVDDLRGRAFFVGVVGGVVKLHVFDLQTFAEVYSVAIKGIDPSVENYQRESGNLMRWGSSGLAFRTDSHVVILDNVPAL